MNLLTLIKSKFKPSKQEINPHEHLWSPQYTTGTHNSKWTRDGKVGFGKSIVFKCECGKWSVKHYGDDVYLLL